MVFRSLPHVLVILCVILLSACEETSFRSVGSPRLPLGEQESPLRPPGFLAAVGFTQLLEIPPLNTSQNSQSDEVIFVVDDSMSMSTKLERFKNALSDMIVDLEATLLGDYGLSIVSMGQIGSIIPNRVYYFSVWAPFEYLNPFELNRLGVNYEYPAEGGAARFRHVTYDEDPVFGRRGEVGDVMDFLEQMQPKPISEEPGMMLAIDMIHRIFDSDPRTQRNAHLVFLSDEDNLGEAAIDGDPVFTYETETSYAEYRIRRSRFCSRAPFPEGESLTSPTTAFDLQCSFNNGAETRLTSINISTPNGYACDVYNSYLCPMVIDGVTQIREVAAHEAIQLGLGNCEVSPQTSTIHGFYKFLPLNFKECLAGPIECVKLYEDPFRWELRSDGLFHLVEEACPEGFEEYEFTVELTPPQKASFDDLPDTVTLISIPRTQAARPSFDHWLSPEEVKQTMADFYVATNGWNVGPESVQITSRIPDFHEGPVGFKTGTVDNFLSVLARDFPSQRFQVDAIVHTNNELCEDEPEEGVFAIGSQYIGLAERTGGVILDICEMSYEPILSSIAAKLIERGQRKFILERALLSGENLQVTDLLRNRRLVPGEDYALNANQELVFPSDAFTEGTKLLVEFLAN